MPSDEKEERKTQVHHQLVVMGGTLDLLHERVGDLAAKLQPILVSLPPTGEGKPEGQRGVPELVPLADDIQALKERLDIEIERILSLTERCEL